jgi:DNA-binding LacI/PurR family transcriptional regulator
MPASVRVDPFEDSGVCMASATIKDVAEAAGVSVATVSYVVNNGPRAVAESTRRRVEAAIARLAYEPNTSARLAIAGLAGLPGVSDLYFLDIIRGVGMAADRHDYDLMLFSSPRKLQSETFFRELARKRMIDGLIVTGTIFNYGSVTEAEQEQLPVVVVGRQPTSTHLRHVVFPYEADAFRATETLIRMGHRRIALLCNALSLSGEVERLQGYRRALEVNSLGYDPTLAYVPDDIQRFPPRDVVSDYITRIGATAIITAPYVEVCGFVVDIGMGGTVAVATLDEEVHVPRPPCLRFGVQLGKYEAGQRAVELLLSSSDGAEAGPEEVIASTYHVYPAGSDIGT